MAVTIFEIEELKKALTKAKKDSIGLEVKAKSKVLHSILGEIANRKDYCVSLRNELFFMRGSKLHITASANRPPF